MSFQFDVRMALFPATSRSLVYKEGSTLSILPEWKHAFDAARSFATVHWSAAPELGLPVAPYKVEIPAEPVAVSLFEPAVVKAAATFSSGGFPLDATNGLELSFASSITFAELGLFYIRLQVQSTQAAELYAIDLAGDEIVGTRQPIAAGTTKIVLCGPGISGVGATQPVMIGQVIAGNIPGNPDLPWRVVADVAPTIPSIAAYDEQTYLGVSLSANQALGKRLDVDAAARENTQPPQHPVLNLEVHRADPSARAALVLNNSLIGNIANNFSPLLADRTQTFTEQLSLPNGNLIDIQLAPIPLLQFLAATGPIEATALGGGVTLPAVDAPKSSAELYDAFTGANASLPFPFVRVTGYFAGAQFKDSGQVDENRRNAVKVVSYARLVFQQSTPQANARAVTRVAPDGLDLPAHTDVELAFPAAPRADALFLEQTIGPAVTPGIVRDIAPPNAPKAFLAVGVDPPEPPNRISRILDSHLPLPLAADDAAHFALFLRDEFGRWNPPTTAVCPLLAWLVAAPTMISAETSYAADGSVSIAVTLSLSWEQRRPAEVRFGLAIGTDSTDPALAALVPASGVTAPFLGQQRLFRLTFDGVEADLPLIDHQPVSSTAPLPIVEQIQPTDPELAGGPAIFDRTGFADETYRVTFPIGDAQTLFATRDAVAVAIVADALEVVSGSRRSPSSRTLFETVHDPRPPQLATQPWQLVWASRPNAANESRATLAPPQVSGGGSVARFTPWRAHETSVFDLLLTYRPQPPWDAAVALAAREQVMDVRVALLKGFVDQLDAVEPAFRSDFLALFDSDNAGFPAGEPGEVRVSGAQTGLELFLMTATSASGVESDKSQLADIRAVAVPKKRTRTRPALSIVTVDDQSLFELTGSCLLMVSSQEPFADADVRFFRDDRPAIDSADEIFIPFRSFAPLTAAAATTYIADFADLAGRQPFVNRSVFIATPPGSWQTQSFTADLRPPVASGPEEEIPSPRAEVVRCFIPPATRPAFTIQQFVATGSGGAWTLTVANLPTLTADGLPDSELYVEFGATAPATTSMRQLLATPLVLTTPGGTIRAQLAGASLTITSDFDIGTAAIRIIGSDPLARSAELNLALPDLALSD